MSSWIMNPYQVANRGQYYRLITSGFLHADWGHLFFNMLSLYFFGGFIEQVFSMLFGGNGPVFLIGFYLVAILVSDIPSFLKHRNDPGYNSLGASGGVSAIIFAAILFRPLTPIYMYFIPIGIPGLHFWRVISGVFLLRVSARCGQRQPRRSLLWCPVWDSLHDCCLPTSDAAVP